MSNTNTEEAGQAVYSKAVLLIYDLWVLGFSNSLLWRCPTKILRKEFVKNATNNHLDVGVGTGYYLDKCLNNTKRRLALLDLNPNSLESTASRASRFDPEIYRANILDTLDLQCDKFDSISMNYLFHCLPGSFKEKSLVFRNLLPYLNDNGVVFGSTILGKDVAVGYLARKLMSVYNTKGIFDNYQDSLSVLSSSLHEYFRIVDIQVIGCVAIFTAKI